MEKIYFEQTLENIEFAILTKNFYFLRQLDKPMCAE